MFGYDWPRFHAAVNDLPAALLFTTVLFDTAAGLTKRASLQAAALWTLWAGVVGGWVAVLAWKLFRRARLSGAEELGLRVVSLAGLVGIIWTAVLGGKLVFEHAAGIPRTTMQAEMMNRAAEHEHAPATPPHRH